MLNLYFVKNIQNKQYIYYRKFLKIKVWKGFIYFETNWLFILSQRLS